ncbi:hypothetical protein F7725_013698 [Dissostichus mawsoni]|uniref:Uncharacterized protein n=1 Tax=Dissostichus mawsoni TaxID=36200 RepID=A0A7J5YU71_DISMA|nr:hypothetical protein F7725_013698 [Dissostichus mawsoni]
MATKALSTNSVPLQEYRSISSCTAGASTKVPMPEPDMASPYASACLRPKSKRAETESDIRDTERTLQENIGNVWRKKT